MILVRMLARIQPFESIHIISLIIDRHLHLAPISGEISMKYCGQSRNMNCDSEISDSLTLHSRIYLQVSTYMHPLYSKDRDWKNWKKSKNATTRKILRASTINIKYKSCFKRRIKSNLCKNTFVKWISILHGNNA